MTLIILNGGRPAWGSCALLFSCRDLVEVVYLGLTLKVRGDF